MITEFPTICVVDDEPSICKALRRLLLSAGFNVTTYGSGQEFLKDSKRVLPDLMVLDVQMPSMTGLDLQQHLVAAGHVIPTLFISANGNEKTKDTAMAKGALAFFQKPVDANDLLGAIQRNIGTKTTRARDN